MITIDDYFKDPQTGRDRRKDYSKDFLPEYEQNAQILLNKVNAFLNELGIKDVRVSSGWRPPSINNGLQNAAKKSAHMIGKAVDLLDNSNQDNGKLIASKPDLLRKYGLFLEDLGSTKGQFTNWTHLDYLDRADRPSRIFLP